MLAERVKEWTREWREQGLREGRQEGLQEGLETGQKKSEILILMRLLERKFGPLSEQHRRRLEEADANTLLDWSERVLTVDSIEEVFKR
jgi:flagellar biosynthesis/type III secretory pathway protein FliH